MKMKIPKYSNKYRDFKSWGIVSKKDGCLIAFPYDFPKTKNSLELPAIFRTMEEANEWIKKAEELDRSDFELVGLELRIIYF